MPMRLPGKTGLSSGNNERLIPEQIWPQQNFTICHGNTFPLDFFSGRENPRSPGLGTLAKCHPDSPPAPCSSKDLVVLVGFPHQTGSMCSNVSTTHMCTHIHTKVFPPRSLGCTLFFLCAWLKRPSSTSVRGREVSKVQKWFILLFKKKNRRQAVSRGAR